MQVIASIDKKVHHLEQGFRIVVAGMWQASQAFKDLGEDRKAAIEKVPEVVWRTIREDLVQTQDFPLKRLDRVLAALDHALSPEAVQGVFVQGKADRDTPLTLRIVIKKHRQDAAKMANGLIAQVISPTLWGVDAPYQVFVDGSARPEGNRGGLMDDPGEAKLLNRMEWALTSVAPGWTEEKAKEWWKDRSERRHDGLEEEDGEREEDTGETGGAAGAAHGGEVARGAGGGGEGGGGAGEGRGEARDRGAAPTPVRLPDGSVEGFQESPVDAQGDALMSQRGSAGSALTKSEDKEEEAARAWLEETKAMAGGH